MANILILLIITIMIRTLLKTETTTSGGALKYIAIAALFAFACVAVYLYHAVFITDTYWWY